MYTYTYYNYNVYIYIHMYISILRYCYGETFKRRLPPYHKRPSQSLDFPGPKSESSSCSEEKGADLSSSQRSVMKKSQVQRRFHHLFQVKKSTPSSPKDNKLDFLQDPDAFQIAAFCRWVL